MRGQLTPEFAEEVTLSLNPIRRHLQVRKMLRDPKIIGDECRVFVNEKRIELDEEGGLVAIATLSPFIGRRVLKEVAESIEWVYAQQ